MAEGYWNKGKRAKEGVYDTIDNVTKFALSDDDYEEFEEWIEYTAEEITEMNSSVSIEDLMDAIAELGALVASLEESTK